MKGWIEAVGDDAIAFVHGVSGRDLDTLIGYCKEKGEGKASDDMRHVMRVDEAVVMDWCNKRGVTFADLMRDQSLMNRFLDDPDNGAFRIWRGRV